MSASAEPLAIYQAGLVERQQQVAALMVKDRRSALLRLGLAIAFVAVLWVAYRGHDLRPSWSALPAAAFVALWIYESLLAQKRARVERGVAFYERGIARLEDRWAGQGDTGLAFFSPEHPYASDLDVFGKGSLFERLNEARTAPGQKRLADWLLHPSDDKEIRDRQKAVMELRTKTLLREKLAVAGATLRDEMRPDDLRQWAAAPPLPWSRSYVTLAVTAALILGACFLVVAPLALSGRISGTWLLGLLLIDFFVTRALLDAVIRVAREVGKRLVELQVMGIVLQIIETTPFDSPRLDSLKRALGQGAERPSRLIGVLSRRVGFFDAHRNQLLIPLLWPTFWAPLWALTIERWRHKHGKAVGEWIDAVADLEALCSLAGFAFENPTYESPVIETEITRYTARTLGHPLLAASKRVSNPVRLGTQAGGKDIGEAGQDVRVVMVSGSNMSGKSTYLRAIGLNAVLAQAGSVVCGQDVRLCPFNIGAAIRVGDSLAEGRSRFFAELLRVRQVVELASHDQERPLLFLLDEIFAGTNSEDRRAGAAGVVKGLLTHNAVGLVTTHDLALTRLPETLGPVVVNVHFQDHLENNEMTFDFTLRPGVVQRSNALALMRAVGLHV
ncbi:MAG: DNA mismatch repair protein MutS [Deltaproteobacteria bacterium]|nr:DNA mismatch repair protein MutS [Deltaproteobacteria bacterium]